MAVLVASATMLVAFATVLVIVLSFDLGGFFVFLIFYVMPLFGWWI